VGLAVKCARIANLNVSVLLLSSITMDNKSYFLFSEIIVARGYVMIPLKLIL